MLENPLFKHISSLPLSEQKEALDNLKTSTTWYGGRRFSLLGQKGTISFSQVTEIAGKSYKGSSTKEINEQINKLWNLYTQEGGQKIKNRNLATRAFSKVFFNRKEAHALNLLTKFGRDPEIGNDLVGLSDEIIRIALSKWDLNKSGSADKQDGEKKISKGEISEIRNKFEDEKELTSLLITKARYSPFIENKMEEVLTDTEKKFAKLEKKYSNRPPKDKEKFENEMQKLLGNCLKKLENLRTDHEERTKASKLASKHIESYTSFIKGFEEKLKNLNNEEYSGIISKYEGKHKIPDNLSTMETKELLDWARSVPISVDVDKLSLAEKLSKFNISTPEGKEIQKQKERIRRELVEFSMEKTGL